jgi:type II secretory pathway component PulF
VVALFFLLKSSKVKESLDQFFLGWPLIGEFLKKVYLSQIALNLSTLISGGVPISQGMEIVASLVSNRVYKKIILDTREQVRAGKAMSSVLSARPEQFTPLFIQMMIVGEKTGHLEKSLRNIVDFYRKDTERMLDNFVKLLEPLLIIILGVMVTILAMSLFVPLFQKVLAV